MSFIPIRSNAVIWNSYVFPDKVESINTPGICLPHLCDIMSNIQDSKDGERKSHKVVIECQKEKAILEVKSALTHSEIVAFLKEAAMGIEEWEDHGDDSSLASERSFDASSDEETIEDSQKE